MATIRRQKVGKYTYWQIVESKRVNGKPRPFVIAHLGTAEKLLYKLIQGPLQKDIQSHSHGAVKLLWLAAEKLDILSIFQKNFSSQTRNGVSVGTTLLLASIHRALKPGSKRAFPSWARQTTLPELVGFDPDQLNSQHFWDQMDTVTEEQLSKVQTEITNMLFKHGLISSKLLFYDLTNFYTYIDTTNEASTLTKRGHNKQKRTDLRQFGLAQATTKEYLLPVLSEVYEGNKSDSSLFIPFLTKIKSLFSIMNHSLEEFTLVFDKGSISKTNMKELEELHFSYVTSFSVSWQKELLEIPIKDYSSSTVNGKECKYYRLKKEIWDKERTLLIVISEILKQGQIRSLDKTILKTQNKLIELKEILTSSKGKKLTKQDIEKKIKMILTGEYSKELFYVSVLETNTGKFDIDWTINKKQYTWLVDRKFGKILLLTNREEWQTEDIISAYRGQNNIERIFKHLKNPYHNAVFPQYHWTDQKIKVHTFVCIIGLLLSQIIWQKAKEAGYHISIETLLDKLMEVRQVETITISDLSKKPKGETALEIMEPDLKKLYETLLNSF